MKAICSISCHPQQISNQSPSQPQLKSFLPKANQTLISKSIFSQCQVLSIIEKSFIAVHYEGEIFLIDQHAACQKLLYMDKYNELKCNRQSKKVNKKYCIPNLFNEILVDYQELLNFLGWKYKVTKKQGTFIQINVTQQPYILTQTINQAQLIYYLQQLYQIIEQDPQYEEQFQTQTLKKQNQNQYQSQHHQKILSKLDLSQKQKQILAQYSCHHSYRFGDYLTLQKAQQIIRKLASIQAPFNCPHSRVLISYYGAVKQLGLTQN